MKCMYHNYGMLEIRYFGRSEVGIGSFGSHNNLSFQRSNVSTYVFIQLGFTATRSYRCFFEIEKNKMKRSDSTTERVKKRILIVLLVAIGDSCSLLFHAGSMYGVVPFPHEGYVSCMRRIRFCICCPNSIGV